MDGDVLGAAADYHIEKPEYGDFMFPKLFGRIAQIYIEKYGATPDDLTSVAYKNYAHARLNPLAQMRDANLTYDDASQVSEKNPSVAPPLRVTDCSQITDGGAAIVLVSGKYLDRIGRDKSKLPGCSGLEARLITSRWKKRMRRRFQRPARQPRRRLAWRILSRATCTAWKCTIVFPSRKSCAYEILGLAEHGKGAELAKSGATALPQVRGEHVSGKIDWEIPVNTGGGLIGDGHPVGATGVRQVFEAYQQLTEQGGRAPDPRREKIPDLQHGRQPHDQRRHDLGPGVIR